MTTLPNLAKTSIDPQARPVDVTSPSRPLQRSPQMACERMTYMQLSLVIRPGLPLGADETPTTPPSSSTRPTGRTEGFPASVKVKPGTCFSGRDWCDVLSKPSRLSESH
ncbi:hypothetical protein FRC12_022716 [Ceratobasidium sp. 428]|nr:hypothetical protein FRC12_022716 [Ceratobasidium sp. 428]